MLYGIAAVHLTPSVLWTDSGPDVFADANLFPDGGFASAASSAAVSVAVSHYSSRYGVEGGNMAVGYRCVEQNVAFGGFHDRNNLHEGEVECGYRNGDE